MPHGGDPGPSPPPNPAPLRLLRESLATARSHGVGFADAWERALEQLGKRDAAEWLPTLGDTREGWQDAYDRTGCAQMTGLVVLEEPWTKAQPYRLVA